MLDGKGSVVNPDPPAGCGAGVHTVVKRQGDNYEAEVRAVGACTSTMSMTTSKQYS